MVTKEKGDITGTISTVMLMGHYVQITAKVGQNVVKCYVNREIGDVLEEGMEVNLKIGKHTRFPLTANTEVK